MKVLVFSDTHLSAHFDQARYQALFEVISQADQVIINGDFWDAYLGSFTQFLQSGWQALFPLLKKKKTIYIHGNHDLPKFADERVAQFSVQQGLDYRLRLGEQEYVIMHGHLLAPAFDGTAVGRRLQSFQYWPQLAYLGSVANLFVEYLQTQILGSLVFHAGQRHNLQMKQWAQTHLQSNQWLICGHSHIPEANPTEHFFNSGVSNYGAISYLWVSEEGVEVGRRKY